MNDAPVVDQDAAAAPAPRRGFLSRTAFRVLTINTVFGLVIGAALYATSEGTALLRLLGLWERGSISGAGHGAQANGQPAPRETLIGLASLSADDPVLHFTQTRMGQVLFTAADSDNCERVLFDNRTGASFDVPTIFCGQKTNKVSETSDNPNRLDALRSSFKR